MTLRTFFDEHLEAYSDPDWGMSFDDFCEFLRDNKILKGSAKTSIVPTAETVAGHFMDGDSVVDKNADEFEEKILALLKNPEHRYYHWLGAIGRTGLNDGVFRDTMRDLGFWDEDEDIYTEKGKKNGIEYGLLTDKILEKVVNEAGYFYDINDVYLIQWVGPFASVEECKSWEKSHSISKKEFNFYYGCGKKSKEHKEAFYIGKSERDFIAQRISQESNPIRKDFRENADKEIWIGRFSDRKLRSSQTEEIRKQNHLAVECAEWALIHGFMTKNPDKRLLNDKKTVRSPKKYVSVINQFYKKTDFEIYKHKIKITQYLPDVILYDSRSIVKFCPRLEFAE